MVNEPQSLEARRAAKEWYIARTLKRGFKVISQSETTVELYKHPGFPAFLRREETRYVDVDQRGCVYVRKRHY